MRETEKTYGLIDITDIKPNTKNPRTISKDKLELLKKSITDFPQMLELRPLILNKDNVVLGGNMRLQALRELGYTEIPFIRVEDLTDQQQKEFIIKDNVSYGEWNWDILEQEWTQDLLLEWGMDIPENKFAQKDEAEEDNYTGVVPEEPTIKLGDLIEIGNHRLLCGDSTNRDHVSRLMNGRKADLLLTDPPYGVSFTGVPRGKDWDMINNDDLRDDTLKVFLTDAFKNGYEFTTDNAAAYIWYADKNYFEFLEALKEGGYYEKQILIWYKGMTFGRFDYHRTSEVCLYAGKKNKVVNWYGGRDKHQILNHKERGDLSNLKKEELLKIVEDLVWNSDVWEIKKDAVITYLHPTQKPVPLSGKIINNSSPMNGLCLDLFSGSGSSMIAAHQLGRTMYGMELDPRYCEVIIDRMKKQDPELKVKVNGNDYKTN